MCQRDLALGETITSIFTMKVHLFRRPRVRVKSKRKKRPSTKVLNHFGQRTLYYTLENLNSAGLLNLMQTCIRKTSAYLALAKQRNQTHVVFKIRPSRFSIVYLFEEKKERHALVFDRKDVGCKTSKFRLS